MIDTDFREQLITEDRVYQYRLLLTQRQLQQVDGYRACTTLQQGLHNHQHHWSAKQRKEHPTELTVCNQV